MIFTVIESRKGRRKRMESEERKTSRDGKTESQSDEEGADDLANTPLPPSSSRLPTPKPLPAIRSSAKDSDTKPG